MKRKNYRIKHGTKCQTSCCNNPARAIWRNKVVCSDCYFLKRLRERAVRKYKLNKKKKDNDNY